jgi:ubiquinone/menaquinone biosynthesis C-methylase UbiE
MNEGPRDPESLHDADWLVNKPDDTRLAGSGRFAVLVELVKAAAPRLVLDMGCGSGHLAGRLKHALRDVEVHGVDISRVALGRAAGQLDRHWQLDVDKADLPMPAETYDVVICSEVLEHVYDVDHALAELARVLKPGGAGLVTVPNVVYWRYRLRVLVGRIPIPLDDDRHLHQFNRERLARKAARAGLRIERTLGHGVRMRALATFFPTLFSDTLVVQLRKKGST